MPEIPWQLKKRGFFIVNLDDNNTIVGDDGMALIFKTKEEAEEYCRFYGINGQVK